MRYFLITIDTEADWYDMDKNRIRSIEGVHYIQEICSKYNMIPTYLVTYEVATQEKSVEIISKYLKKDLCEVGHHLHVWSTPPLNNPNRFGVDENWIDGLQIELADDIFEKKMLSLHNAIKKNFNIEPKSHRAGKWAVDAKTLTWLHKHNYKVDTSIRPASVHKLSGKYKKYKYNTLNTPNIPYYPAKNSIFQCAKSPQRNYNLLEVPATAIKGDLLSKLNIRGMSIIRLLFYKFGYKGCGSISFRPSDIRIPLNVFEYITHSLLQSNLQYINFMFHSNELTLRTSPYSKTDDMLQKVKKKIEFVLKTAREYNLKPIKLSQVKDIYNANN